MVERVRPPVHPHHHPAHHGGHHGDNHIALWIIAGVAISIVLGAILMGASKYSKKHKDYLLNSGNPRRSDSCGHISNHLRRHIGGGTKNYRSQGTQWDEAEQNAAINASGGSAYTTAGTQTGPSYTSQGTQTEPYDPWDLD
ncbi:hypothetical protein FLONG3_6268 [Fusarium longipes]|uniref:Uncharacterized protein n=1 Tax=Fusarium longipes TaxID=694270 RepID=A0A395SNM8_9HYPO|nr:hypothetical protein FLONG3_6268 [Fusarium longipes]